MAKLMEGMGNPVETNQSKNKGSYASTPKSNSRSGVLPPEVPERNEAKKRSPGGKGDIARSDKETT